jgi:hypothetical protein
LPMTAAMETGALSRRRSRFRAISARTSTASSLAFRFHWQSSQ